MRMIAISVVLFLTGCGGGPHPDLELTDSQFDRKYFPHLVEPLALDRVGLRVHAERVEECRKINHPLQKYYEGVVKEYAEKVAGREEELRRLRQEARSKLQFEHASR